MNVCNSTKNMYRLLLNINSALVLASRALVPSRKVDLMVLMFCLHEGAVNMFIGLAEL